MPFREKMAWVTLVSTVVVYGFYFTMVGLQHVDGRPVAPLWRIGLLGAALLTHAAITGVAAAAVALSNPKEARERADERDRAIRSRAGYVAYHLLLSEMVVVGVVLPFERNGWDIVNAALFAVAAAEVARYALVVNGYRRAWHG